MIRYYCVTKTSIFSPQNPFSPTLLLHLTTECESLLWVPYAFYLSDAGTYQMAKTNRFIPEIIASERGGCKGFFYLFFPNTTGSSLSPFSNFCCCSRGKEIILVAGNCPSMWRGAAHLPCLVEDFDVTASFFLLIPCCLSPRASCSAIATLSLSTEEYDEGCSCLKVKQLISEVKWTVFNGRGDYATL